jgi:hypothetical protein
MPIGSSSARPDRAVVSRSACIDQGPGIRSKVQLATRGREALGNDSRSRPWARVSWAAESEGDNIDVLRMGREWFEIVGVGSDHRSTGFS